MSEFRYSDREESEALVLDRAFDYIRQKYGEELFPYLSVLDLGCGEGRLIPRFAAQFSSVTGLETDRERCDAAMEKILDEDLENATALCMDLEEYIREFPNQTFDIVLCSHVLEYLKHETACGILENLKHVLGPDSVCLFLTTFTEGRRNQYTDEEGFVFVSDDPDKPAVCRFAQPWMERFLLSCGLRPQMFQAFGEDAFYLCEPVEGTLLRKSCGPETASGKICYMQFYSSDAAESLNTARIRRLQEEEGEDAAELRDAFAAAEQYLYDGELRFPAIRHFRSVDLQCEKTEIADSHLVISFYPHSGIAQVSVNLTLKDVSCDDFIFLHKVQSAEGFFTLDGEPVSVPELCEKTLKECGLRNPRKGPSSILIELNRFGTCTDVQALSPEDRRCLYGMLTGDEGYLHVPQALVEARMEQSLAIRDFARVIACGSSYVLLNLNRTEVYADYIDYQKPFGDRYFGALDPYFTMDAPTAGVNSGLFFSAEAGQLICTGAQRLMDASSRIRASHGFLVSDDIKRDRTLRAEILRTLNKPDQTEPAGEDPLYDLVRENLDVSGKVGAIRSLLERVESDLDLLYSKTTNRMVTILTILGLIFALIRTINSF